MAVSACDDHAPRTRAAYTRRARGRSAHRPRHVRPFGLLVPRRHLHHLLPATARFLQLRLVAHHPARRHAPLGWHVGHLRRAPTWSTLSATKACVARVVRRTRDRRGEARGGRPLTGHSTKARVCHERRSAGAAEIRLAVSSLSSSCHAETGTALSKAWSARLGRALGARARAAGPLVRSLGQARARR